MPGVTRKSRARRRPAGWAVALGASGLVHAGLLVGLLAYGRSAPPAAPAAEPDPHWSVLEVPAVSAPLAVATAPLSALLPADLPPPTPRLEAPPGGRHNPAAAPRAPADTA